MTDTATDNATDTASQPGRLLFVGGTPRGLRVFETLLELGIAPVRLWIMQEDAHEQRKVSDEFAARAAARSIPFRVAKRLGPEDTELVAAAEADLLLAVGWRTIIPTSLYRLPRHGSVLIHDSLLPRYRGFAPTNWAVINGEAEGGATLLHMADAVDAGDIVGQIAVPIGPRTTAPQLYDGVVDATVELVRRHIRALLEGTAPRHPQDECAATYACSRTPEDGRIDWSAPTEHTDRLIRGLTYPYPGAWTTHDGAPLVVWEAEPLSPAPRYDGRITGRVVRHGGGSIDVLTADGVLRVHCVGRSGDERIPADVLVRSVKCRLGA